MRIAIAISDAEDASRGDDEWLSEIKKIGQIEGSEDIDILQVMRKGTFCEASALFPYVERSHRRFLLFSIWCAEKVAQHMSAPSRRALEIAKKYASGEVTKKEFLSTGRRLSSIIERVHEKTIDPINFGRASDESYISTCADEAVNSIYCFRHKGFSAMHAWESMMMAIYPDIRPDIDGISDDELPWDRASAEEFLRICQSEPEDDDASFALDHGGDVRDTAGEQVGVHENDDLHRSGLAFGWLEETQPRRWSARPYWLATGAILALLAPVLAILIWVAS
jgi:hypothetical protein